MDKIKRLYLYMAVFVNGAVILMVEILGTRVIAPYYGSSIYVWSALIIVTLGSLALGYFFGGKLVDKFNSYLLLSYPQLIGGFALMLVPKIYQPILIFSDQFGLKYGPLVASGILFSGILIPLGMISPAAVKLTATTKNVGKKSGNIFALGTLGSIAGGLISAYYLLSVFGISEIFSGTGLILFSFSLFGFLLEKINKKYLILSILIALLIINFPMQKKTERKDVATKIIYRKSTYYGDIKITTQGFYKCLYVNGMWQSCLLKNNPNITDATYYRQAKAVMDNLPENSRVLLLGLGGGVISSLAPESATVDSIEIDPEILRIAKVEFGFKETEKKRVYIDDARRFIRKADDYEYDLVISDLTLGLNIPYYFFSQENMNELSRITKPQGLVMLHIETGTETEGNIGDLTEAILTTGKLVFKFGTPYSSNQTDFSNSIIYLYQNESKLSDTDGPYYKYKGEFSEGQIISDDHNILENLYLDQLKSHLADIRRLNVQMLFPD